MTFETCAESVRDDVDGAGFDEIVLAGHSLAGCSMPTMIELLGRRVRHAVFIVDLDAGHMCMVSQPAATADILNSIADPARK